ncbi:fasciclin domain-containing protein [Spirosoma flavus]
MRVLTIITLSFLSIPAISLAQTESGSTSPKTGTGAAVRGARKSPEPAVVAGSTERNSSIHDFIASSPNYTTLQNALQAVNLYATLAGSGPYTLFAPTNEAFKKLPTAMQSSLLEGRNREKLKQLLAYHLLNGVVDKAELAKRVKAGGGKAQLQTVGGGVLTAQLGADGQLTLKDEQGKSMSVNSTEKRQANGVVYGVAAVLLPKNAATDFR